ncbi:MAG: hypothetical protein DWQ04_34550 [Chloroflexi bacterium]|nr:MAG: hypothetical protein DWQ04_34550 [Chloroflexota bacterium]
MELKQLLILIRRWAWLLLIGLMIGAGGGLGISLYQTPVYQASTRIMVMQSPESSVADVTTLSDQELAQTYIELLVTKPVLDATSESLGFSVKSEQISGQLVRGTRLLQVTVRDNNPQQAATIANKLVEVLLTQNQALQTNRFSASEESLQAQIKDVEAQIALLQSEISQVFVANDKSEQEEIDRQKQLLETQIFTLQNEVVTLEQEIEALTPRDVNGNPTFSLSANQRTALVEKGTQLSQKQFLLELYTQQFFELALPEGNTPTESIEEIRKNQLQSTLTFYEQLYSTLLTNYESVRLSHLENTPNVVQVEEAIPSTIPVQPRPLMNIALGAALGLILTGSIAFVIEYLDDTLKTPADISNLLKLPVIGFVADVSDLDKAKHRPYVARNPRSPVSEAFRNLRTNLEFAGVDSPLRTILVTSPGPGDGKTTVAVNLATAIAQGNKHVALIDCDLRRPRIHRELSVSNRAGLSDLFRGQANLSDVFRSARVNKLVVVPSGNLPPNPLELLGSEKMTQILNQVLETVDMAVIDSPPFPVSDALVLASKVSGVVLVIQPGRTHAEAALAMLEQLKRADARVLGVVLNRIPQQRSDLYGGYYLPHFADIQKRYHMEGGGQQNRPPAKRNRRKMLRLFGK